MSRKRFGQPASYAMRSSAILALFLTLLAAAAGTDPVDDGIDVYKCCAVHQMLAADGKLCVEAPWSREFSFKNVWMRAVTPPLNSEWVRHWLPPGLSLKNIRSVYCDSNRSLMRHFSSVNASSLWNASLLGNETLWRNTVAFFGKGLIARPKPGGYRVARYCVDAALPPLAPFAMRFIPDCSLQECAKKCCSAGNLLNYRREQWVCVEDGQGSWSPSRSALALDPEFPLAFGYPRVHLRLSPWGVRNAHHLLEGVGEVHLRFSTWDVCFDFYRSNGSLREGVFYKEYSRVTRGVYWLLRPLCVLSALLLLASLLSVACDKSMRQKIHGRSLASHAVCLLAFNIGQIGYYVTIGDQVDAGRYHLSPDLHIACKYIALWMYFLLTAAWFWLTALCLNMAMGFRLQVTRQNKESTKRFLALSAFAWGLPVLLTTACSFLIDHEEDSADYFPWYTPSLAETRVCYNEYVVSNYLGNATSAVLSLLKSGTALFYFGPVCCLVGCNIICLAVTLRKVQYLRRGNSVLRREEDHVPHGQRHPEIKNPPMKHNGTSERRRNRRVTSIDEKTIKLYIKMILMSGGIELLTEVIMWSTTVYEEGDQFFYDDLGISYRAAGYVTDFFRAAVVTWLAAPEGGYLGLMRKIRRGKEEKKSGRAGVASRKKQNVAKKMPDRKYISK